MKKAAVISLILLLVVSLGTSGYLLMDRAKVKAELENSKKSANKKAGAFKKLAEDFKKAEGDNIDSKNALTAAKKDSASYKSIYEFEKGRASKKYEDLQTTLDNATKNQDALMDEITNLSSTNRTVAAELETVQSKLGSLTQQFTDRGKQVEDKDKELEEIRMTLEPYTKLGLTPDKILELSKKRPVDLKVPAIAGVKSKVPGKLKNPLSTPSPESPKKPTPHN